MSSTVENLRDLGRRAARKARKGSRGKARAIVAITSRNLKGPWKGVT